MVHARVPVVYVHFALMYKTYHIFPVLPIKDLINEDGDPTTPHKLETIMEPSVSHLRVLFCPCVVHKAIAHVETKTLNMRHQAQKGFRGIFIGIPEHQKGYLVYIPSTRKIISSYNVVFDNSLFLLIIFVTTFFGSDGDAPGSDVYPIWVQKTHRDRKSVVCLL